METEDKHTVLLMWLLTLHSFLIFPTRYITDCGESEH